MCISSLQNALDFISLCAGNVLFLLHFLALNSRFRHTTPQRNTPKSLPHSWPSKLVRSTYRGKSRSTTAARAGMKGCQSDDGEVVVFSEVIGRKLLLLASFWQAHRSNSPADQRRENGKAGKQEGAESGREREAEERKGCEEKGEDEEGKGREGKGE